MNLFLRAVCLTVSNSLRMGRDGFQLAESLGLKEAPGPFLTGCGNVPLTTDWVLGAGSGCCTLGKGAGRRLWGAEVMVTALIGKQPLTFVSVAVRVEMELQTSPAPALWAVMQLRRKHLAWGDLSGSCVFCFLQHRWTWPIPPRRLAWEPWLKTFTDVTVYHHSLCIISGTWCSESFLFLLCSFF